MYDWNSTKGKGYIGMITGNHDMQRLAHMRTVDEIKTAMVFLFTMPGVPFVYYGDEIGMDYIEGLPSKEGGYNRTGSRTPMQWNNSKNHGFSTSDTPYLPTDTRKNAPTVQEQLDDKNSLLMFVKEIIQLHKKMPALHAEGEFSVLLPSYPFVYERADEHNKIFVAINPSGYKRYYNAPQLRKVLFSQNIEFEGNRIAMDAVSFIVAEMM